MFPPDKLYDQIVLESITSAATSYITDSAGSDTVLGGGDPSGVLNQTTSNSVPLQVMSRDWGDHPTGSYTIEVDGHVNHDATGNSWGAFVTLGADPEPLGWQYERIDNAGNNGIDSATGIPAGGNAVSTSGTGQAKSLSVRCTFAHPGGNITSSFFIISQNNGVLTSTWNETMRIRRNLV